MAKISFTQLQKKYGGMYVLMDKPDGKVVVASRNLGKAFKEAEKKVFLRRQFNTSHHMELSPYMKLKFPYGISAPSNFGIIQTIFLWLYVESLTDPIPFSFLFDTGADVTSFPASVADKLGIDLDKCPQEPMSGFEGTTILVYRSQVKIRFNKKTLEVPCVFNPNEEVPILLGRAGIIDKFDIPLDGRNKEIMFKEI